MRSQIFISDDLDIEVCVDQNKRLWPPIEAFPYLGQAAENYRYTEITHVSFHDARHLLGQDTSHLKQIETAPISAMEAQKIGLKLQNSNDWSGLDIGIAGTVYTLAAFGCLPAARCNGDVLQEWEHHEWNPLVIFFTNCRHLKPLIKSARRTHVGLDNSDDCPRSVAAASIRFKKYPCFRM